MPGDCKGIESWEVIEALSDYLAQAACEQIQEAQRQTSPWMQVCFCFPFSFKSHRWVQPLFSVVKSQIAGAWSGLAAVSPWQGGGECPRCTHHAGLCQAVRAVAVVTPSGSARAVCRNDSPQCTCHLGNSGFSINPWTCECKFVQMLCVLMSWFCTSTDPPHVNSLESVVYSRRVYLQRAF